MTSAVNPNMWGRSVIVWWGPLSLAQGAGARCGCWAPPGAVAGVTRAAPSPTRGNGAKPPGRGAAPPAGGRWWQRAGPWGSGAGKREGGRDSATDGGQRGERGSCGERERTRGEGAGDRGERRQPGPPSTHGGDRRKGETGVVLTFGAGKRGGVARGGPARERMRQTTATGTRKSGDGAASGIGAPQGRAPVPARVEGGDVREETERRVVASGAAAGAAPGMGAGGGGVGSGSSPI
nr:translation initiation factor IF-2-like [Aegilops tauschii subsp. strangulata]